MARQIKVEIVRNDLKKTGTRVRRNLEKRVDRVAKEMRDDQRNELQNGGLPLQPDTGALAQSLTVQKKSGSDFDARRRAAKASYVNGASQWRDAVRSELAPDAYSEEHFEKRAGKAAPPLPVTESAAQAAIMTMLIYGIWWEFGHGNLFTRNYEQRPWFASFLLQWWATNAAGSFKDLEK